MQSYRVLKEVYSSIDKVYYIEESHDGVLWMPIAQTRQLENAERIVDALSMYEVDFTNYLRNAKNRQKKD